MWDVLLRMLAGVIDLALKDDQAFCQLIANKFGQQRPWQQHLMMTQRIRIVLSTKVCHQREELPSHGDQRIELLQRPLHMNEHVLPKQHLSCLRRSCMCYTVAADKFLRPKASPIPHSNSQVTAQTQV